MSFLHLTYGHVCQCFLSFTHRSIPVFQTLSSSCFKYIQTNSLRSTKLVSCDQIDQTLIYFSTFSNFPLLKIPSQVFLCYLVFFKLHSCLIKKIEYVLFLILFQIYINMNNVKKIFCCLVPDLGEQIVIRKLKFKLFGHSSTHPLFLAL